MTRRWVRATGASPSRAATTWPRARRPGGRASPRSRVEVAVRTMDASERACGAQRRGGAPARAPRAPDGLAPRAPRTSAPARHAGRGREGRRAPVVEEEVEGASYPLTTDARGHAEVRVSARSRAAGAAVAGPGRARRPRDRVRPTSRRGRGRGPGEGRAARGRASAPREGEKAEVLLRRRSVRPPRSSRSRARRSSRTVRAARRREHAAALPVTGAHAPNVTVAVAIPRATGS